MFKQYIEQCTKNHKWVLKESETITKQEQEQIYALYKQRPLFTPIDSVSGLFSYYPCSYFICCSAKTKKIEAAILYWRHRFGNKVGTSVALNVSVYKSELLPKYAEILQQKGFFAELSGALEYLLRTRYGMQNIKDVTTIRKIVDVSDMDIFGQDDPRREQYPLNKKHRIPAPIGSYLRNISGLDGPHRKALYGSICDHFDSEDCSRKCTG